MSSADDYIPTEDDIRSQLQRMLTNIIFSTRPQQANLLKFIIEHTLQGDEITDKFLREHLFPTPPYKAESNIARRTVGLLKDALTEYYETEGKADLVKVTFPEPPYGRRVKYLAGEAYRPKFLYNPDHDLAKMCAHANFHLKRTDPTAIAEALGEFAEIMEANGNYLPALIGFAETVCLHTVFHSPNVSFLQNALFTFADAAVASCPGSWRAHASRGAILMCLRHFKAARKEFHKALEINRLQTECYPWYHLFIFTTGDKAHALKLIAAVDPNDATAQAIHGIYLYAMRRFEESEKILLNSLYLNHHFWISHLSLSLVYTALGKPTNARACFRLMREDLIQDDFPRTMPGLAVFCLQRDPTISTETKESYFHQVPNIIKRYYSRAPGLQTALVALAQGDLEGCVAHLEAALKQVDPLILWLPYWHIFEPTHEHPRFKTLLDRIARIVNRGSM